MFDVLSANVSVFLDCLTVLMFITRIRWKVIYFNSKTNDNSSERYVLKTLKCPKEVKEPVPFENDLIDMLKVIKLRKVKN